ncbi:MAG: hypothetical protein JEZ06_01505 [Anaerolineaceae bacterium]|nr:hypothetical protein [Anaerolineaceae bacterium]
MVTKLHIPAPRSDLVERKRLFERLDESCKGKVTLISAPAGFGKSTLLSAWIKQHSKNVAWVSLDEEDNRSSRFLIYFIAAFQKNSPHFGEVILQTLYTPQPPTTDTALSYLINEISSLPETILVLDDYHIIKSPAVHEILICLLRHMPENLHLVLATRSDPPLPLPLLRGQQHLTELRTMDLRFTLSETIEFFDQKKTFKLERPDVKVLNRHTEGWVTGLQMAALSMQKRSDIKTFIKNFAGSNRFILDYLLEEVLEQQTEEIQCFLKKTSILAKLNNNLCQAVTGKEDCQQILERLERGNLFLLSLDDHREWFRYHHLFADLLRQRLVLETPDSLPELHSKAGEWYSKNNDLGSAIDHFIIATDYEKVIKLIYRYLESMWQYGDQIQLSHWLTSLPSDILCDHPEILAHFAFGLCFAGNYSEAENQLKRAEECRIYQGQFRGMAAIVWAFIALYRNQIEAAEDFAETALKNIPDSNHLWRSLAFSIRGDVDAFNGYVPTCEKVWTSALREAEKGDSIFFAMLASAKLIVSQKRLGQLHKAANTFVRQISWAKERGFSKIATAGAMYTVYGDVLLQWGKVDEAKEYMQSGLSLSEKQQYMAGIAWSSLSLIHLFFVQKNFQGMGEALKVLEQRIDKGTLPEWTNNWFSAWKARLYIIQGDFEGAELLFRNRGINIEGEFGYPNEVEYLSFARLLMAKDKQYPNRNWLSKAQGLLQRLYIHLQEAGWVDKRIETLVLLACNFQEQGELQQALECLKEVFTLTESENYLSVFTDEGSSMASLLYKAMQENIYEAYAGRLLAAFSINEAFSIKSKSENSLIETLSVREFQVLEQLANGASNQEIAFQLHIALGTVKNHLKNIYGKLLVNNRTQAAARARELNLLD